MNQDKECCKCHFWSTPRGVCSLDTEAYISCVQSNRYLWCVKESIEEPVIANDNVNHPSHYTQGKIECIDYIIDHNLDFLEGNVVKYVTRWKYKNGLEDLEKALYNMKKLVEREKNK